MWNRQKTIFLKWVRLYCVQKWISITDIIKDAILFFSRTVDLLNYPPLRWGLPKHRSSMVIAGLRVATYSDTVRTLRRAHADLCDLANRINSLFGVRLLVDITAQLLALLLRLKIVIIWIFNAIKGAAHPHQNPFLVDVAEMERALAAFVLCPIHMGTVYSVVFYCTRTVKKVTRPRWCARISYKL